MHTSLPVCPGQSALFARTGVVTCATRHREQHREEKEKENNEFSVVIIHCVILMYDCIHFHTGDMSTLFL